MWIKTLCALVVAVVPLASASDINALLPATAECQLTSSMQQVDFGAQSYGRYQVVDEPQRKLSPGTRLLTLTALCAYPETLAMRFNGSASSDGVFAHGMRGNLQLTLKEALLDGKPVEVRITHPQQNERYARGNVMLIPQMELTPVGPGQTLLSGRQFTASVEIKPIIDARNINNEIHSQSHFNVQLVNP